MSEEAPTSPEPNDCCGNGCVPCIWDIYYEELRKWQNAQNLEIKEKNNEIDKKSLTS